MPLFIVRAALALALLATAALPSWSAPVALLTIVDGDATVIRESAKFPAAEGVQTQLGDIIHAGAKARLVRLEFADGSVLDLGADTHLLLRAPPPAAAPSRAQAAKPAPQRVAQAYVSRGWAKVTPPVGGAPAMLSLASRHVDLPWIIGTVVTQTTADDAMVFVEAGSVTVTELRNGVATRSRAVVTGQLFSNRGGEAVLSPRPVPQLLAGMPRAFADSLPLRAAKFAHLPAQPVTATDIAYDDVAEWINAERRLRTAARDRWAAKAQDATFRARLVAELSQHPEWDRVLFPEKYLPRRPAADTSASSAAVSARAAASAAWGASGPVVPPVGAANASGPSLPPGPNPAASANLPPPTKP